jgi:benzoylformate decarboxylase
MSRVTGKEAVMQILSLEGVDHVFGIPGATETQFVDALEDHPEIRYVLCLHELVAVGMAEGYSRASGKVGVLNLHTGTGLAAGMPMLSNAWWGGVPLVVTVGQQDTRLLAEEPAMSDNLVKIAAPFVKWATEVIHPQDLPTIMRRAFKVATHPPTGPVMVSLPLDVLADTLDFAYPASSHSFTKLHPDDRSIAEASRLLSTAGSPAIIVEDGITKCDALDEVVRLAEQVGARVYQPWMSDVNFPVHHPLYIGDLDPNSLGTRDILEATDVLVVIGSLFFQQAVHLPKPLLSESTKVIQIDNNPWQIAKNFPVACGVEGDIKVALNDLSEALEEVLTPSARSSAVALVKAISAEKRALMSAFEEKTAEGWDRVPISGTRLMAEIRDAMEPGTRIVDDCWSYSAILRKMVPFAEPKSYIRARGGGSIGGGMPTALGVKLASPERPVVCVTGDGSALWSIQSLWNAAHDNLPVTFIMVSNGCYRQVRMMKTRLMGEGVRGRDLGTRLCPPQVDFRKIAEGMGVPGQQVREPQDLRAALTDAFRSGAPHVVDVLVDPSF